MNYNSITNKPFVVSSKEKIKTPKENAEQIKLRQIVKKAEQKENNGKVVYRFK